MAQLPDGVPAPGDGSLPDPNVASGFAAYVHIPFCAVRCGYCDFNTYTNLDFGPGASASDYHDTLAREIELSAGVLGNPGKVTSVFFGGGTPTLLPAKDLAATLERLRATFGIEPGAEVTTEANPETLTFERLRILHDAGFTRVSFGMQSAVSHVLQVLDRAHTPGQVDAAVGWARELGLEHSVDLIYGAPGESMDDWRASLEAAIALDPPHISAYGLTIEPGTKMGGQVRRGEIPEPDPDVLADKYMLAEELLSNAGYEWYEVSNWAKPGHHSRHNLAYWQDANWWGYGPGAHSHVNGTRWWNVKHPIQYAAALAQGKSPAAARELLTADERREEQIMLGIRLREGIATPQGAAPEVVAGFIADGLVEPVPAMHSRLILTVKGRLLADTVIRALW
ncbi:oxygen-independent coproporphyrinogen-3 oxidase [Arcanobacterium wilhelmae]|uniref:Heme chaperone HemW n=1 Tax=Arcanobacterium wilhelmae TaxID=1803177 RepID=A0ABT9NDX4_9ACTO|nr:radical SAM family heme chaperone HemW [Arcanobacterium wilhelmae]MDP9801723.1 oxygen-independent coproporphyrinogen-3 oxidase [Arcanobacterium wilhelmae]WFN91041.1 radical SAM family heme chaperone HemW [Arcanobacterium wilhelmae]